MSRHVRPILLCAVLAALMPLHLSAQEVTIETARGPVTLALMPERIAVYDIAAIDTLTALDVPVAGVPDRLYLDSLAAVQDSAAVIGTLFEPDLEGLAMLGPDLIIVGGRSSTQFDAVAALAPVIDMTIWDDPLAEARARLVAYGALFDKADAAAALDGALLARIEALRDAVQGKGNALIVMTNGPKLSAYGRGTRFGWIHETLGIAEAHADLDPQVHGDAISFEFIAKVDPDWLIVVDRSAAIGQPASVSATLDNPLVAGTKAAQAGRIVALSPAPVYIAAGGYSALMTTLDELLAAFAG